MRVALAASIVVVMLTAGAASAASGFEHVRTMPFGEPSAIAAVGDVVIHGITNGIMVVDVADPATPVTLARLSIPGRVNAITVVGDRLYIAAEDAGVAVVDVTDIARPILEEVIDTPGRALDVAVSGSWLFVADDSAGLRSIDLSGAGSVGSVVLVPYARQVEMGGQFVVVTGSPDLWLVDISDPTAMVAASTLAISSRDLVVDLDRLFVATYDDSLSVFDAADPFNPVAIGSWTVFGETRAVASSNGLIWLKCAEPAGFRGLRALDFTTPGSPVEIGSVDLGSWYGDLAVTETRAHLMSTSPFMNPGSPVVDVTDPSNPVRAGSVPASMQPVEITIHGDLALVELGIGQWFEERAGIDIIDVSKPDEPVDLGVIRLPGMIDAIAVDGSTVVVADRKGGLHFFDISNPARPEPIATHQWSWDVIAAALADATLYVVDGFGLWVLDITDPISPVVVGSLELSYWPGDLWNVGDHLYVGSSSYYGGVGITLIDVADASRPVESGLVSVGGYPIEFVRDGDVVYTIGFSGFQAMNMGVALAFDVSDSGNPVELHGEFLADGCDTGWTTALAPIGNRLVASYDHEVWFIRTGAWSYKIPMDLGQTYLHSAATVGHHLLAADAMNGLMIFFDEEILVDGFESGDTAAW
ncbi:MAG: hypothetical protein AB1Z65_14610 [Candidatus Sulfomarinibacteraceae bacterium]